MLKKIEKLEIIFLRNFLSILITKILETYNRFTELF